MTLSNVGSILASLTQLTQLNRTSALTHRVKDLSVPEFICLLDFITAEFQQFLRAIEMINNEALETMLEQVIAQLSSWLMPTKVNSGQKFPKLKPTNP
jgi:adenylate cyclase